MIFRPSPIARAAKQLGAEHDIKRFEAGERVFRVQCGDHAYWLFRTVEAATGMAEQLVEVDEPPGSPRGYRRPSGRIDLFESFVWPDIGAIPTRAFVYEAGEWRETWSGIPGVGAAAAKRKAERETPAGGPMLPPHPHISS